METQYTSLIERYFDEELSSKEKAHVEELKKTNSNFMHEFELFEKAHKVVNLVAIGNLKEDIRSIHKGMDNSPKSKVRSSAG